MSEQFKSPYGEPYPEDRLQEAGQFRVRLASVGNPDFGQNPRARKYGAKANHWLKVGSIAEASAACRKFITDNELGGGNWSGGDVQDEAGKVVARISYNGRAWLPSDQ
ncbi:MAG: hypothetical protein FD131_4622 [Rhodocyclaceae bacterium]|nr:MAG: hypothetical protein FD131_4622 [Rhodocyclaceae bacterium]